MQGWFLAGYLDSHTAFLLLSHLATEQSLYEPLLTVSGEVVQVVVQHYQLSHLLLGDDYLGLEVSGQSEEDVLPA